MVKEFPDGVPLTTSRIAETGWTRSHRTPLELAVPVARKMRRSECSQWPYHHNKNRGYAHGWTRARPACVAADRSAGQLYGRLDAVHLRSACLQPADRNHRRRDRRRRLSHRLAVDYRRHPELREAGRRARYLAGITFPLANPHILVRPSVGLTLHSLRHRHAGARNPDRLATDGRGRTLFHLPHRPGMAGSQRPQADVRMRHYFFVYFFKACLAV